MICDFTNETATTVIYNDNLIRVCLTSHIYNVDSCSNHIKMSYRQSVSLVLCVHVDLKSSQCKDINANHCSIQYLKT